jgi:hypothetical protein
MKNIHIIATPNPSRLAYYQESTSYNKPVLQLVSTTSCDYKYQHIYITSDEEIKKGDWVIDDEQDIFQVLEINHTQGVLRSDGFTYVIDVCKKIIFTTDQDLIKDGIQAIDDEFLEWFVKNPSCESVEIDLDYDSRLRIINGKNFGYYSAIIPQEEPKQEENEIIDISDHDGIGNAVDNLNNELPQETLEEFIEREGYPEGHTQDIWETGVRDGAQWQQEQILQFLYSEITERRPYSSSKMCEEVIKFIEQLNNKK